MKWLKHILFVFVWLATSWPCGHAVAAEPHGHGNAHGIELCVAEHADCHCHACDQVPCTDKTVEAVKGTEAIQGHLVLPARMPRFSPSRYALSYPVVRQSASDMLASLRTVRLLI